MIKRFLTFALSVGFFIWLPNAFADGSGILSLDAPATIRQVQTTHGSPLLTLRVENIQVRAGWGVEQDSVFTIKAGVSPNEGVLHTVTTVVPGKEYVATIYVEDKFDLLNPAYVNLTARAVITVEFVSGKTEELGLEDVRLTAVAGKAEILHTFAATGGSGGKTYTLVGGDDADYFDLDKNSGVLSVKATALIGIYTLSVKVEDVDGNQADATATVEVLAALSLATVSPLTVIVGRVAYTLTASGGVGTHTYAIVSGNKDGFALDAAGVLSLSVNAKVGSHTLTVQVMDARDNTAQAVVTVEVSAALELAEVPSFTVIASMAMSLTTFIASGGIGTPTYTIVSGNEKEGFTLNAASGVLSLVADAEPDTYELRIQAMDAHNNAAETVVTVGVSAVLSLADAQRLGGAQGTAISLHIFAAQGGIGARTYTLLTDDVEDYFSLGAESGVLSLLVSATMGTYTLSVEVRDSRGNVADALATVRVAFLFLADAPRLYAVVGREVSLHTFDAKGVVGTATYAITLDNDKDYFSIDAESGVLSVGADAAIGVYTLSVSVKDSRSDAKALAVVEVRASLSLVAVPPLTVIAGRVAHTLAASGGIGTLTYAIVPGNEDGFAVDAASGVLSLSVNAEARRHTLTLQVADARANTVQALATVEVSAALMLAEVSSFTVIASMAMSLRTFIASGGIGTPTYEIVSGNEKEGFTLNAASGVLSLVADAKPDTYELRIQAMDARANTAETVVTVGVSAILSLAATPSFTVIASVGMNLHMFIASGGIGTPTYTILAGNEGKDFTLNAASGVLSLSVNAELGSHTLTVQVMDGRANTADTVVTVEVSAALVLAAAPSFTVIASMAMSLYTFVASGGIGTPTYTILAGNEGKDFTLNAASGVLSLSVNAKTGEYTLTVQVMDGRANTADTVVTVEVSAALELAATPSFTVIASVGMNLHTFVASGGIGTPTYTILAGNEGKDFTLNAASGVLSLSVNAKTGEYTLTVQVMDGRANTADTVVTVEVSAALVLAATPSFTVIASVGMNLHTFVASGGIGTPTYTIVAGNEGRDFTLNAASGVLSLSVNAKTGEYTLTVQVMDARDNTADTVATVEVLAALALAEVPSFTVIASVGMNLHTFVASGGIGTPTYTILAGNEGKDFTLNAASGVLSLQADAEPDTYVLRIQAMDGRDNTAETVATVGVSAVLSLADAQRLSGIQGVTVSLHIFAAQGGIGSRTYTLLAGDAKGYFSLDAESGVLSLLTVAPVGTYTLSVQVSDDRGNVADALATVDVAFLFLADVPRLYAVVGREVSLHTFAAKGVIGAATYAITLDNDKDYFSLDAESGVLSVRATAAIGVYTLSVSVKDSRGDAEALAVVEVRASLSLATVPPLTVIAGRVAHTLAGSGGIGTLTYAIVSGNEVGFALDAASGVLSLSVNAEAGRHTLTLQVADARANTVQALATVEVSAVLVLSDAPSFTVIASVAMSLHTFIASGGIGIKTYTLVAGDDEKYFAVDAASGVFSLSLNTPAKDYTLTVRAMDARDNTVETVVTVGVSAVLELAATPSFTVIASVGMNLHRFIASGGIGAPTYTILAGNEGRDFTLNAASGVLSLSVNAKTGEYTLTVQVMDGRDNTADTVVTVEVSAALVLAAAPSFTVIASVGMNLHTFIASGGIGTPTYTILAGNEGRNFTLNAASGVLSLSVNAEVGRYTLTVQAMDERDNAVQVVAMVEVRASLSLATVPPLTVIAGRVAHTLAASGGIGTLTYTIAPGNEVGFALDAASGVLSLSVNATLGSHTLTVQVMDERANTADTVVTVEVSAALVLAESPSFTVIASVGMSLHTFVASGGIGTPTYTIVAGNEGRDFTLNAASGVLSLSVNAEVGRHTLTVQVMDERNNAVQVVATVGVSAVLALAATPSFTVIAVGMNLHTFIASGGIGTPTYTILAGNESRDFTLNAASGVLSLSVNAKTGEYTLTVQVMDERDNTADTVVTVEVSAALVLAAVPSFTVIASVAMSLHTFVASGGIGTPTYTILAGNEGRDFTLNATSGVLSLSVNAEVGSHTLTVQVMDARNNAVQVVATVGVSAALELAAAPSFTVIASVAMSLHTFVANGGIGTPTYTIVAGNDDGQFALNATSGVLSLQADAKPDTYALRIQAMDGRDNTAETVATVGVSAVLSLADAQRLSGIQGVTVSLHIFAAQGGIGSRTYTLLAGDAKGYFSLDAESGVLSLLTVAPVGTYTLSVQVSDDRGNVADALATVDVAFLFLADVPRLYAVVGREVSLHTFAAKGVIGAATYAITLDNDKDYFSLDADSGVLSVRATAAIGVYTLSVSVKDSRGDAEALAVVEVRASLSLATVPPLTVIAGRVAHTLAASGGIGTLTYAIVSGNEVGFALDAASGVLSLQADAALGRHTLTLQVADARANTVQAVATVEVSAVLVLSDAPPFTVIASVAMSLHTFIASGGIGIKTYTLVAGDDEKYFSVDAASGVFSLSLSTPAKEYTLTVRAMDARDNTVETVVMVGVSAVLALAATPSFTVIASVGMNLHTFVASGGIGTPTYTIVSGNEGRDFTLNAASGVLSLSVDATLGSHTLTVQVMDERANTADTVVTVEVSAALVLAESPSFTVIASVGMNLHTFVASGGIGTPTYTILAGNESRDFTLNATSGVLSLSVNAEVGRHTLTVQAMDERGNTDQVVATVEVSAALALAAVPSFTVIASVGMNLHTFVASGGIGTPTYTILAGNEGRDFTLNAASGVLSLSVNAELGSHTLTVQVMDGRANTADTVVTVEVSAALALAAAPSFTVIASVGMSLHMFIASGGIGTPTYTIVAGNEGRDFTLNATSGVLSLSVNAEVGSHTLTVQVMDERGNTDQVVATVGVSAALELAAAPSFTVIASVAMSLHTFIASGGIGVKTYTLLVGDNGEYFAVDAASGVLSLSMNAPAREYMLTVQVMDARNNTVQAVATVGVSAVLSLAEVPLLEAIEENALSLYTFAAGGGIGSRTYTLLAGNDGYFSVGAESGVLSLSVNAAVGRHTLTVQVMDERSNTAQAVATVGVSAALTLAAAPSFTVIASVAMSLHTFIAGGGIGRKTYTLAAGDERYFSVGADSGVLSLSMNAEAGRYTLTVRAMDEHHNSIAAVVMVGVSAELVLADAPLLRTVVGEGGNLHTFAATGGIGDRTYTIVAGNDDYFNLDRSSGVLSMEVTASVGMYTLSVQVADAEGNVASALATVEVASLLLRDVMLYAIEGREVSLYTFEAGGGSGAKTYTIVAGNEDRHFTLAANIGVLSVQGDVSVGIYTLSMLVTDADGNRSEALAVVAVEASLFLVDAPSLAAVAGITMSVHTFAAGGGIGAKTYTIAAAGDGVDYFILNAASGVLSVANATVGVYTLSVTVSDSRGNSAQARGTVEVVGVLSLADALSLVALARLSVEVTLTTFAASGGYGAKRYTLIADESDYFALADSGELSLPQNGAMQAGEYTLSVAAADSLVPPQRATAAVVVRIAKNAIFVLGGEISTSGYPRDVWFSLDGKNWSKQSDNNAAWSGRSEHQVASHQGRLYLMGGQPGNPKQVWSSADGKSWSSEGNQGWLPRKRFQVVEYKGQLYAMGGRDPNGTPYNDVRSPTNGKDWTPVKTNAAWVQRSGHQVVVHNDRMYLLGGSSYTTVGISGRLNDVWSSADGSSWSFEGDANWDKRYFHQAVSHQGRLYVVGGDAGADRNDVWWSVDGKSWNREVQWPEWATRKNYQVVSYDGLLYMMGGHSVGYKNDVWSSADGKEWTIVTADAGWAGRAKLQAVVFPPPLVMWGVGASEAIILTVGVSAAEIYTVTAQYGLGPYTYSLTPENRGIKINGDGVLSLDDQTQTGAYAVTVRVEDKEKSHAEIIINIEIRSFALADAPPLFVVAGLSEGVNLHAFTVSHGVGAYTYELVGDGAGYFTLGEASGVLSVTANVSVGVYTLSVVVSDENNNQATAVATVAAVPILSLVDAPLISVVAGKAVSLHTFTAVGGVKTKTYNLVNAPGFFNLGESSGILSVQAVSEVGIYTVSVQVSDDIGQAAAVVTVAVVARLSLADASLLAVEKKAVSLHTFAASGGIGARTYTLSAVNETGYFVLDASGGVLSLSASASAGAYTLTVGVKDERGNAATAVATVNISAALSLADAPLLPAVHGEARDLHTFVASGGLGVKTYTLVAGAAYFTVGVSSGVLSVDENATVGIYTLSVQAADADGNVAAVALATVEVVLLFVLDAPMLYAIVGQEVSLHTFETDGGSGAKVFTIVAGNKDKYFTIDAVGVLSVQGNASVGVYTLSVAVDNKSGNRAEALAVVAVEASLFLADMPSLVAFTEMTMSLHTFAASGGIGAKTYTLAVAEGQEYFTLNATSGVLLATNAALGVYTLSVTVSDSRGNSAQARGTVEVVGVLSLADAPSLEALARLPVEVSLTTFAASGGYGAKRYTLIADKFDYFAIDAVSGELSLPSNSAMLAGVYTLRVGVSDSLTPPQRATAAATVQIARNRIFVLGGRDGSIKNDVWSSADGEIWRRDKANTSKDDNVGWSPRQLHQAVAHNGRLYVMGGADGGKTKDVWWSVDGANWQQEADADWTGREIHQAVSYKGRMYVLGGQVSGGGKRNDVWSSADGETWERDKANDTTGWTARDRHQAVVHNGRMYVLGGQVVSGGGGRNDVWSSADGANWSFEGNADWDARYFHQAVSHAGRLYVLGGSDRSGNEGSVKSDVWSSVDGRSWVREKANTGVSDPGFSWSQRFRHQSLSRDGLLYVLGGNANGLKKDVWSSADGRSWDKRTDAAWTARIFHQAVVFPPNLVLSGTSETITLTLQAAAVALHTLSAQYGGGQYAYSLPEIEGFRIDGAGVLLADNQAQAGAYTLTVRVEDEEGSHAESIVNIELRVLALADAPPLFVIAGLAESVSLHAFTVSHGVGAYAYNLVDDSGYFTLDAASGVLSVSANVSVGVYTVSVEVSDDSGNQAAAVATVEALPMLSLVDAPLLSVVAGKALELHTFTAAGGIKAKTYNLVGAAGYFTLGASSGILSVQAVSEAGIYTVSVRVSDGAGNQATAQATVAVIARLSLADASLMAVEKKAVSLHTFVASGGIGARTYTLSVGNGTGYFVLDAASGVLSLSASAGAGEYTLTVGVKDERDNIAVAVATVNISAALSLAGAPQLLFAAEGEAAHLHTFVASGGLGVKTYTVAADAEYFMIGAASGVLSVNANATVGIYTLSVQAADADGNVVQVLATAQVVSLLLADVMLYAIVGREVSLHTFEAGGGGGVKTYTIVAGDDDKYFTLDAVGVLSVQGSATVGIYTLSIAVDDGGGNRTEVLAVVAVEASLFLADAPPLTVMAGLALSVHTFAASGGIGVKAYTITAGNEAKYFTLNAASGVLSLRATAPEGFHTLTVQAADEYDNLVEAVATVDVSAALSLAEVPLLEAVAGMTMSVHTFAASGGIGAKTYTLVADNGAGYFAINATSGVLSVANATVGVYTLSVKVSDSRGSSVQARATVEVSPPMSLADAPPLEALARLSVMVTLHTFVASDGIGSKRYTIIAAETSYFALDADSGELSLPSNSAMLAGAYTLRVEVSDSLTPPQRATAAATVQIARNGIFVLGGNESQTANNDLQNDVWWSADGETWSLVTVSANWTARELHQVVAHRGRMYLLGGVVATGIKSTKNKNDVWSSLDGKNWRLVKDSAGWTARGNHQALVHKGRMYLLGGRDANGNRNDVWSSADGETWRRDKENNAAGWTKRESHQAVSHNGRLYVLGGNDGSGYKNDVWSSADGANWRFEGDAKWTARWLYKAVSHNGRLYVLGGNDGGRLNDVWSSVDGRSWVREKDASWTNRGRHQALSRDGLLYVLGGNTNGTNAGLRKDVWSSPDGKSWDEETAAAGWGAREYHQVLAFPPNLALSGTSETITLTLQAELEIYPFSAQYGGGQYAYSLPTEIEGFKIDGAGVLSANNQAQAGVYTLTVRVKDAEGGHAESIINIELRVLALADAPPLFAVAGLAESVSLHAFTVSHGVGASTYSLVDDSGYFILDAKSGVLSVTANVSVGVYTVSVEVSDDSGNQATAVATVEAVPMLSLADAPLLSVVAGKALSLHTFVAVGGSKAKTYNLLDAAGYFTLSASSGILSVQAFSEVGIYTVSVEVSDSAGNQATAQATVGVIARLSLAGASLMAVEKKAVILHTFAASGGIGARTYTLSVGNETGYFVLDAASGVLSLSASASTGEYTLTVGVKDERANIATAVATVNISAALSLAGVSQLLLAAKGEAKNLHTFVASGGLGAKTYTLAAGAEYFTVGTASGILSVDENAPLAMYTLSVQVEDADGNVVQALATAQVVSLLLADVMLYAIVGREVSLHTFEAGGEGGVKTYTIVAGNDDKYFTLDANSGVLSVQGSVTVGVYTLSIAADDEGGNRAEVLAVVAVEASLFLADAPPLTVMAGLAVSLHIFAASGGIGVKAYTITAGNEAKYFTLNAMSGVLSLRATAPEGFYTLTVQAADEDDNLAEAVATVDVSVALSLAEAPLLEAVAGMTMSVHTFAASGGIGAKTYTLSADNGVGYFAMNATSGVLSVASATVGVYTLSVQVSDSRGNSVEARATVQVVEVLSLADAPSLEVFARLSVEVSLHTFVASGGYGAKRYTLIADKLDYFAIDADSGELSLPSNSAMLAGAYTLLVGVSDSLRSPQRATAAATVQIARNGIFVMGGQDSELTSGLKNDVWWSADGKNWVSEGNADWPARANYQAVAYHGRLYVLGGDAGSHTNDRKQDVWWSADGKNWVSGGNASWPGRKYHQAVQHRGRLYVLGGYTSVNKNDAWSWAVGESSWRQEGNAAWPARRGHQAVSHNGRIYVMGGRRYNPDRSYTYYNDVWSSADGRSWVNEGNAPWLGRYYHQAVSHMGRLYVLGGKNGRSGRDRRSDVWSSLDGRSWRQEKANDGSAWDKREEHQALSRDGRLYVLGGNGGTSSGGYRNDVWWSTDGKSWEKEPGNAAWLKREAHQAVVFPPSLVLSGTSEKITLTAGVAAEIHTFSAQYGFGQYTYSLALESEAVGFDIDESSGVLSADSDAAVGGYTLTVQVEDEEGSRTEAVVQVEIVAASTAALSAVERFAWGGSGGSRNDVGLSEHGGSGRREGGGLRRFQQAMRYQGYVLDGG